MRLCTCAYTNKVRYVRARPASASRPLPPAGRRRDPPRNAGTAASRGDGGTRAPNAALHSPAGQGGATQIGAGRSRLEARPRRPGERRGRLRAARPASPVGRAPPVPRYRRQPPRHPPAPGPAAPAHFDALVAGAGRHSPPVEVEGDIVDEVAVIRRDAARHEHRAAAHTPRARSPGRPRRAPSSRGGAGRSNGRRPLARSRPEPAALPRACALLPSPERGARESPAPGEERRLVLGRCCACSRRGGRRYTLEHGRLH